MPSCSSLTMFAILTGYCFLLFSKEETEAGSFSNLPEVIKRMSLIFFLIIYFLLESPAFLA